MGRIVAVITGDLVASTKAGPKAVGRAMDVLAGAAQTLADWAMAPTRFTRHRGDGWQLYLEFPGLALRGTVLLAASLRASEIGLATRISVGIGAVETVGGADLADASGAAFTWAGQTLDQLPKGKRLVISGGPQVTPWQEALFDLVEWQVGRWSPAQAEAVVLALDPAGPTQAEMANRLGITRQALQARLRGAGLGAMEAAFRAFEGQDFR